MRIGLIKAAAIIFILSAGACSSSSLNTEITDIDRDECDNVPNCVSVSPRNYMQIKNGSNGDIITMRCPESRPYFWDWGYESSGGLEFTLLSVQPFGDEEKSDEIDIEVYNNDESAEEHQYRIYCACSSKPHLVGENHEGQAFSDAPVLYTDIERFELNEDEPSGEDTGGFSYVGENIIRTLKESDDPAHTYQGITWNYSTDNLFRDDFILQTPNVWGASTGEKYLETKDPCTFNSQRPCNSRFRLPECSKDADCKCGGVVCRGVDATVVDSASPIPMKLCMRPQDVLWNEVYKVMVSAGRTVDITTLNSESQAPDGRFRSAIRNAVTYLATTGREVSIRILIGHFTSGKMKGDPGIILDDILGDLRDANDKSRLKIPQCRLRVQVGYYEASDAISLLPWLWGDSMRSLFNMSMNHSKIVCADGSTALVGGQNMFDDDYLSRHPARDVTLRVEGSAAYDSHAFASRLWKWLGEEMAGDTQDHIYAWSWQYTKPGEYQKKNFKSLDLTQLDAATCRKGSGSVPVIGVGKLGYWYFDKSGLPNVNASELAIQEMLRSAKKNIMISQQDVIWGYAAALEKYWEPPYTVYPYSWYPIPYVETIISNMIENKELNVYFVVSNLWSRTGDGDASSGSYYNGLDVSETAKMFEYVLKLRHPEVYRNRQARLDILCKRLHVAPLRFGPDNVWDQEYTTWWGNEYQLGFANHAKTIIIDSQAFYVGSHNFYPMNLQEYGLIVDDQKHASQYMKEYWEPMWRYSGNSAVCGGSQACMFK